MHVGTSLTQFRNPYSAYKYMSLSHCLLVPLLLHASDGRLMLAAWHDNGSIKKTWIDDLELSVWPSFTSVWSPVIRKISAILDYWFITFSLVPCVAHKQIYEWNTAYAQQAIEHSPKLPLTTGTQQMYLVLEFPQGWPASNMHPYAKCITYIT